MLRTRKKWILFAALVAAVSPSVGLAAAGVSAPTSTQQPDRAELVARVDGIFDMLAETAGLIPDATIDPSALAASLGGDPQRLLRWVRDNTDWVPYVGALRGPRGVLMDRLGNSYDRALLLAELLRSSGHDVRLARAELSQERAAELAAGLRPARTRGPHQVVRSEQFAQQFWQIAAGRGVDTSEMRPAHDAARERERDSRRRATLRADAQADLLAGMLEAGGPAGTADAAREALVQHWWVQARLDRIWTDLDPLLPDAEPGWAAAETDRTVAYSRRNGELQLERGSSHEVVLRVVVEQSRNGRQREREALEHVLRPHDIQGAGISFSTYPLHSPVDLDTVAPEDMLGELRRRAARAGEWLPVLRIGQQLVYTRSFNADGSLQAPDMSVLGGSRRQLGGALGQLGQLDAAVADSRGDAEADAGTYASAAWLEFEIRVPGEEPIVHRRALFDLLGETRASGQRPGPIDEAAKLVREAALTSWIDVLVMGAQPRADFVELAAVNALLDTRDTVMMVMGADDPEAAREAVRGATAPARLPMDLFGLAVARAEWADADGVYMASPNVLAFRRGLRVDEQGALHQVTAYDIVANELAVVGGDERFATRLRQGVLDTNLEALLLSDTVPVTNTAELMASSPDPAAEWVVVTDLADVPWDEGDAATRMRSLVAADLDAGYAVVAPRSVTDDDSLAWWRIDPQTGTTLGMMAGGGQASTERIILAIRIPFCVLPAIAGSLAGTAVCATLAFSGASGLQWFVVSAWTPAVEAIVVHAMIWL